MQILRLLGDVANFLIISVCLLPLMPFAAICIMAEALRLMAEKGQMAWSGVWQHLPHRQIATRFNHWAYLPMFLRRYCNYYRLSDTQRMIYILRVLRHANQNQPAAAQKLAYVTRFCIVPDDHGLRQAKVRDVAAGVIYIHQRWTNDPYLLIGVALRRSPWLFDPRYLRRPFYYRTEANGLMTLLRAGAVAYVAALCIISGAMKLKLPASISFFRRAAGGAMSLKCLWMRRVCIALIPC